MEKRWYEILINSLWEHGTVIFEDQDCLFVSRRMFYFILEETEDPNDHTKAGNALDGLETIMPWECSGWEE